MLSRLFFILILGFLPALSFAGLSVFTSWSSMPPNQVSSDRVIDFGTRTLVTERDASRLTFSTSPGACGTFLGICVNSAGSVAVSTSSATPPQSFVGNFARLTSGTTNNSTSLRINLTQPSSRIGFLWSTQFNARNTQFVRFTLENNSTVTLRNCTSPSDAQCIGAYVPTNWLSVVLNFLFGWLFGDIVNYYSVYVQYFNDAGLKIRSVEFITSNCANCGFLSADTSQNMDVDFLTYTDPSALPHHYRVTAPSSTAVSGSDFPLTVTACSNAACSQSFGGGASGVLAMSGVSGSWLPSASFSITAGSSSATVNARFTSTGTAAIALSSYAPNPSGSPPVLCGMGTTPAAGNSCSLSVVQPLHHVRVSGSASGLTCSPNSYTISACSNADCSVPYTFGLSGAISVTGGAATYPSGAAFSIPAGSSSTVIQAQLTQPVAYTVGVSGLSVTPSSSPQVYCGMGSTPSASGSCSQVMADSGFVIDVPNHFSGDSQNVTISAVRKSDNSLSCTPAFAGVSKSVNFRCTYSNPTSGFVPAVVGGAALNAANNQNAACDVGGRNVSLNFNSSGVATTTVSYGDAGQLTLNASYQGSGSDAGLVMTGTDVFVATPPAFAFSAVTAGPIKAGAAFSATVTAVNRSGARANNFGRELTPASATLTLDKKQPTGPNSRAGTFSGGLGVFSNGVASASNLRWSEVGNADLTATSANYLGSGSSVVGVTGSAQAGAVGPFTPDHFVVFVSQACTLGSTHFTYSGQPFVMTATAMNANGEVTENYDGGSSMSPAFAKAAGVTAATNGGTGQLELSSIPASSFVRGVGALNNQMFTFSNKMTEPTLVALRAINSDGVSSAGKTEHAVSLRSGRLRVSNAFGSERSPLELPMQAQYWTGKAWALNEADSCTVVTPGSVVRSRYLDHRGASTSSWSSAPIGVVFLSNGQGKLRMSAPTDGLTGTVELSINLGNGSTDQSCNNTKPASTGLNRPWLRALNGSCANTHDRDPSARATFGVYSPETQKIVDVREVF